MINSGNIYCKDSLEFRSLFHDLLKEDYFDDNYKKIVSTFQTEYLSNDFPVLIEKDLKFLESILHKVNTNILNGSNEDFNYKTQNGKTSWWINYKGIENKQINHELFNNQKQIKLFDLLIFVNKQTNFLNEFTHILHKNVSKAIEESRLYATIMAYGVNMGLGKMSSSSDISYNELRSTASNYLRIKTLTRANEVISNAISELPIYKYYNVCDTSVHSSSDGQKYNMGVDAFNARYSPKYFGTGKGVSVLTLNANFIPLSSRIISANEYEGNHVLELLLMNETNIQPDIHSTDTHGTNDINFALLKLCGFDFAPRYKNLNKRTNIIYGTEKTEKYNPNYILKPVGKINKELILSEENNVKRLIASLLMKTATVSTIVRKISHLPDSNRLKKAIIELDKIYKTIYILSYIDDPLMRQYVQIALNRGEAYHKLKRAVLYANGGKIRAKTEIEQTIYQESCRLICNAIIYFNSYLLSELLIEKDKLGQSKQIDKLRRISPIAWYHINIYGTYNFTKESIISDIQLKELIDEKYLQEL